MMRCFDGRETRGPADLSQLRLHLGGRSPEQARLPTVVVDDGQAALRQGLGLRPQHTVLRVSFDPQALPTCQYSDYDLRCDCGHSMYLPLKRKECFSHNSFPKAD
eukprot:scaffold1298_cov16-Prasinocladus_malaysianus.AAC.1